MIRSNHKGLAGVRVWVWHLGSGSGSWVWVRYYVAEGVRLYSQATWAEVMKDDGRKWVAECAPQVVDYYIEASQVHPPPLNPLSTPSRPPLNPLCASDERPYTQVGGWVCTANSELLHWSLAGWQLFTRRITSAGQQPRGAWGGVRMHCGAHEQSGHHSGGAVRAQAARCIGRLLQGRELAGASLQP
jgi:hypothetical protein